MPESQDLSPADDRFADVLKALKAVPLQTSPRWIWYQAGFLAGRRRAKGWRAMTAASTFAAMLLVFWGRQTPRPIERLVYVERRTLPDSAEPSEVASTPSPSAQYLRLCQETAQSELEGLSRKGAGQARDYPTPPARWPESEREHSLRAVEGMNFGEN